MIGELKKEYPECVNDTDISLPSVLVNINAMIKEQFIIIIDEWDCLFQEDKNNEELYKEYINLLRGLFKGTPSGAFLKLAYYSVCKDYVLIREMPAGNGFSDMVFLLNEIP